MDENSLLQLIQGEEWKDLEFKVASNEVPKSVYDTVSAFSNTNGGTIVFGIHKEGSSCDIIGVRNVDKVQNDFLSAIKGGKLNHRIEVKEDLKDVQGKNILLFHIPEADRTKKPIYPNGDIRQSFIRRGGCNQRCTQEEIHRFLRDASSERWEGEIIDLPLDKAFDVEAIAWYRKKFQENTPGYTNGNDIDFLHEWGYLVSKDRRLYPTRASVLLFGSNMAYHQLLSKPVLDMQWIPAGMKDKQPDVMWYDRIVFEENLINTWRGGVRKFVQYSPKPFKIDPHTMMRDDTPPEYRAFRELAVNLLIHQDYADQGRKAVIKFFKDGILFWNPGDVFGRYVDLLEPGEKEVRNPKIADAFRRISLCERAVTGLRMVMKNWTQIGNPKPVYEDDKINKSFEIRLPYSAIMSLDRFVTHNAVTKNASWEITIPNDQRMGESVLSSDQVQTENLPSNQEHVPSKEGVVLSSDQVQTENVPSKEGGVLSKDDLKILSFCKKYRSLKEISIFLDQNNLHRLRKTSIDPLLVKGYLERKYPESPRSPHQKYRATVTGLTLIKHPGSVSSGS